MNAAEKILIEEKFDDVMRAIEKLYHKAKSGEVYGLGEGSYRSAGVAQPRFGPALELAKLGELLVGGGGSSLL